MGLALHVGCVSSHSPSASIGAAALASNALGPPLRSGVPEEALLALVLLHRGERDHIPNAPRVRQQHDLSPPPCVCMRLRCPSRSRQHSAVRRRAGRHEAVDADPEAGSRRHSVLERHEKVLVHVRRLLVACRLLLGLLLRSRRFVLENWSETSTRAAACTRGASGFVQARGWSNPTLHACR